MFLDRQNRTNFAINVNKKKGEKTIAKLKEEGIIDYSREITTDEESIWIPVKRKIDNAQYKKLPLKKDRSSLGKKFEIKSFDIIGDIIIIFIPDYLVARKYEIGNYLLQTYSHVKAVYREIAKAEGEFRIQKKELIAGQGTETIHKEFGLQFKLDIEKVFFSPRQVTERRTLTKNIRKGENVCVFFSGIGAIPIYISKFSHAAKIVAIELNEIAHKCAKENIKLNNVSNVELINGDVRAVTTELLKKDYFDLVVMPLPKYADNFLMYAKSILHEKGRLIIFLAGSKIELQNKLEELAKYKFKIKKIKTGSEIAPKEWRHTIYANLNP